MIPKQGKIYLCEWKDAISNSAWIDKEDIETELEKDTKKQFDFIGRFIEERNGFYCFESGQCSDGALFSTNYIPKNMIIKIKEIK